MPIHKRAKQLVEAANAEIESISALAGIALLQRDDSVLVDLRDIRERIREGFIPGSLHAPRGMLEFWVDPESPYHREVFATGQHFVFYCASGWRSALATQCVQQMGLAPVCHIEGGFADWLAQGGPVTKTQDGREPKPAS
jgi:rhodanese-related sulfurtransferase